MLNRRVSPRPAAILKPLLMNDWSSLTPDQTRAFRETGTVHILAISGLHVGLLAAFWVLLPFWATDRAGAVRTRLVSGAGVVLLAYLATFSALGYWR